jgi:hypothetical protein
MADQGNGIPGQSNTDNIHIDVLREGQSAGGLEKDRGDAIPKATGSAKRRDRVPVRAGGDDRAPKVTSIVQALTAKAKTKSVQPPYDPDTAEACPLFWEVVTMDRYDADTDRYLPEIMLTRVDGGWEAVIRDIETSQETRFCFVTFVELPQAAEKHLASPRGLWRPFRNRKNQKGIARHEKKKT